MCGIAALSRAPQSSIADAHRFVLAALLAIESRGYDSVGAAWTRGQQNDVWYDKKVGTATKVAQQLDLAGRTPIRNAIMHTRWATQGAHTYDNAHPVVAENVVLVHNGILRNDDELLKLAATERVGEVDSWALAAIVHNAEGIGAEHPADVLDLIEGDAAVAWLDSCDPAELHLARVVGRPMTLGWTKRGDLVMSSTRQTLQLTARLADVTITDMIDVPNHTYLKVREGVIVEWRTIGGESKPPPKRTRTKRAEPRRRSVHHGITDLYENHPESWWDEAAKQLGDDWADDNWPSGVEQIARRPRNEFDW